LSLALGALMACFLGLGNWQLNRADEKTQLRQQFEQAPGYSALPTGEPVGRYTRVDLNGRFDTERHLLIDNQVHQGRAGVHVLTPFALPDGRWILVNRGWLPLAPDRRVMPAVPTVDEPVAISGRLDRIYRPGRQIGAPDSIRSDTWPQLLTYPEIDAIGQALGVELYPLVLLLDRQHPSGFEDRDWQPVNTGAAKHRARAMQWFTFATTAFIIWIVLGFRREIDS
jgi:surfeit locus 1 family protein